MKKATSFTLVSLLFLHALAQDPLLVNVPGRAQTSLNGPWNCIVDPYEYGFYNYRYQPYDREEKPGKSAFFLNSKIVDKSELLEYNFDLSDELMVPGDWNTQREALFFYEGTLWYKKSFDYTKQQAGNRVFLYFGAVNYRADVYLNGKKLGTHEGGFTPFNFEVTNLLMEKDNFVVVKVDNKRTAEGVPTLNTDWWNYGGITRDVMLVETPGTFIIDYFIQLDPEDRQKVNGHIELNGPDSPNSEVLLSIPELGIRESLTTDGNGMATFKTGIKEMALWSPENPRLYKVEMVSNGDTLGDRIGFRTIETRGSEIILNGEAVFLKGICIHEERPGGGRVRSGAEARRLLEWTKELGCNYVRLAHYPHNEYMVRLADEMGILVWEEIPVYWTIDWENASTYQNAEKQLSEVIRRDRNRASVIIWSMSNETPQTDARNSFLGRLADHARQADPTRLISAALQSNSAGEPGVRTLDDPFADKVDVMSFNQYIGWYEGLPPKCREVNWTFSQDKPVLVSEFGAGAKAGYHADSLTRWSEEYQAWLYKETLSMLERMPQLQGFSPWILMDFRSPRRPLPVIQDYWNRKGLVSETGEKKKAFYILQDHYRSKSTKVE